MLTIKRLDIDEAKILIEGAAARAREMGIPMCIAVTDESGHLINFDRMNGGKISSISIAIDKASTGAIARNCTHEYNPLCVPGIHITNGGHFSIIGGGLPVFVDGEIVGGIGVSSGTAEQDRICAEAAIQHFYAATGKKA